MASLGEYTFVTTNLLTGKIIDEVELQSMHWSEIYNRPGSGRATARIHHPKTTTANFNPWNTGLWVLKDGDLRFGGIVSEVAPREGTGVIDIPIITFSEYLRYRLVKSNSSMTNATQSGNDIKWAQKDQFQIADDLVKHTQTGNGNLGITTIWSALSGVLRDFTLKTWEFKMAGEVVEDFAARDNGFDWRHEYYYSGVVPKCRIRYSYPRQGIRLTEGFVYTSDGTQGNIRSYDMGPGLKPLSGRVALVGAGEGDSMVRTAIDPPGNLVDYDEVYVFKDVSNINTLLEHGRYAVAQRSTSQRTFVINVDWGQGPEYTEFKCGDEMPVYIDDGYNQVNSACTVISKEVVLSQEHDEDVKVNMFELSFLDAFG